MDAMGCSRVEWERHRGVVGGISPTGYGGHFRAVQGFKYLGEATCAS